ncbi:LCP family protein [Streptococcus suis]|uniref:Regulatory protein MsrR n=1 Tax=Streptococcus suis TaxID=1307 RepID=A0A4T2GTU3_STRSU|nr:LCP family protein [Streptococcus suis]MBM7269212.1 LCP family protein [Streptococcus suis]TII01241.1 LytR family transcriptional regulator [Streptococcus suis]
MTKYKGILSHHEELRIDYLQKNIHYLNDKEKRELAYLQQKLELRQTYGSQTSPVQESRPSRRKSRSRSLPVEEDEDLLPDWNEDHGKDKWKKSAQVVTDWEENGEEELPTYPKKERMRKPFFAKKEPVAKPKKKKRGIKTYFKWFLMAIGLVLLAMGFMAFKGYTSVENKATSEVFYGENTSNGVNILILGTDGRVGETSDATRTDSIMVLNVNNSDNKVKMVSFMRDTLIDIGGYDYKLNVAYTFGEQNNQQGAENVRQVLKENFDIDIKYYAMIDFSTFATAIDTLFPNGVTIDAQFGTVNGYDVTEVDVPDDLNMENGVVPSQTIQEGVQQMDGRTLLNYARFRKDDENDFGRTRRQQQVMAAILSQVKNPSKLFTGAEAIGKVYALTSTNIPGSFVFTDGIATVLDGANGIEQTTIPEYGDWIDEYDVYGGLGLKIDFYKYQEKLAALGLR